MGRDVVVECILAAKANRRRREMEAPICKGSRKRKTRWDRDYPEYLREDFRRWERKSRWDHDWEEEQERRLDEEIKELVEMEVEMDEWLRQDRERTLESLFKPLSGELTDPEMIALDRRRMELHRKSNDSWPRLALNEEERKELDHLYDQLLARERCMFLAHWGLSEGDSRLYQPIIPPE